MKKEEARIILGAKTSRQLARMLSLSATAVSLWSDELPPHAVDRVIAKVAREELEQEARRLGHLGEDGEPDITKLLIVRTYQKRMEEAVNG